jgi:hypothetical protein
MSAFTWGNQFQMHIQRPQFQIFSLLSPKIHLLMSASNQQGSIRSSFTWLDAKVIYILEPSGCPSKCLSYSFSIFDKNWEQFPRSREKSMRRSLVNVLYLYYISFCTSIHLSFLPYLFCTLVHLSFVLLGVTWCKLSTHLLYFILLQTFVKDDHSPLVL